MGDLTRLEDTQSRNALAGDKCAARSFGGSDRSPLAFGEAAGPPTRREHSALAHSDRHDESVRLGALSRLGDRKSRVGKKGSSQAVQAALPFEARR